MAKIRFGYSDDFTAKNSKVGINTTDSQANLDVVGVVKGQDLKVTGVSSQTGYEGFLRADHQIEENTQLNFGQGINASLSGEIIVETGKTVTVNEVVKETAGVGNNGNLIWKNIAGNNGDGKLSSGLVSNWDGKAFHFDNNDHVELPMSLGYTTKVSAFAWFKHGGSPAGGYHIIFGGQELEISIPSEGQLRTGLLADQRYVENYGSTGQLTDGSWHYIGFTYDGTTKTSYIDGVFVGTQTVSGTLDHTFGNRAIGRFGDSTAYYLNGYLSAAQIYDRDLTASEILSNYNLGPYYKEAAVTNGLVLHLNANNPSSYPGTVRAVDTTDTTIAGGSQVECMKVYNTFTPPSGDTNQRPSKPKPGQLYYNYDLKTIEFHDGYGWRQVDYTTRSGRGVFANGRVGPTPYNTIDMITIPSLGNAVDFGDSTQNAISPAGVGNGTRGIFAGGYAPAPGTTIEYVTMASQGNAISFGSITPAGRRFMSPAASSTRGVFFGGRLNPTSAQTAEIKYIEMGTLGNTQDFGNLSGGADMRGAAASSPTRGVYTTGTQVAPSGDNRNEYVTIAAKSNSVEFGDLTVGRQYQAASSNSVRMVIGGGAPLVNPGGDKTMDYITIASLGNAIDFGNLTVGRYSFSSVSTQTRAVWAGGSAGAPNDNYNVLDYVEISTLGDAMDFGDLTEGRYGTAAASDSHGGLGGF